MRRAEAGWRCSERRLRNGSGSSSCELKGPSATAGFLSAIGLVEIGDRAEAHEFAELAELVERSIGADAGAVVFQVAVHISQRVARGEKAKRWEDSNRIADFLKCLSIRYRCAPALDHVGHQRPIEA